MPFSDQISDGLFVCVHARSPEDVLNMICGLDVTVGSPKWDTLHITFNSRPGEIPTEQCSGKNQKESEYVEPEWIVL